MEQLEKITSGARTKHSNSNCAHSFILHGESKVENGVQYEYVTCEKCNFTGWVELTSLFAPADKVN